MFDQGGKKVQCFLHVQAYIRLKHTRMEDSRKRRVMFRIIKAVVFKERTGYFRLEKILVLALFGSLAKQPCKFSEWAINTYEVGFN